MKQEDQDGVRGKRSGREEAVREGGSGHGVGSHGPRTVTLSVAPRVTLYEDRDS
jgi:hypothetical protein